MLLNIQLAKESQADLIADFQIQMAKETENLILDFNVVNKGVKTVFNDKSKGCYYVAMLEDKVIASLLITFEWSDWRNGFVWWIQSVFVLPQYRGQKVFNKLYHYLKSKVESNDEISGLRLYVDKSNIAAQKVYEKMDMNGNHYQLFEWMKA